HRGPVRVRLRRHRRHDPAAADVHARPRLHAAGHPRRWPALPRRLADHLAAGEDGAHGRRRLPAGQGVRGRPPVRDHRGLRARARGGARHPRGDRRGPGLQGDRRGEGDPVQLLGSRPPRPRGVRGLQPRSPRRRPGRPPFRDAGGLLQQHACIANGPVRWTGLRYGHRMSRRGVRLVLDPEDEYPHEPDPVPNYNESMYFNSFDLAQEVGGWFRLGNRVNEGYAERSVCVYLPDGRVGFTYGRPSITTNDAMDAGGLRIDVLEPFERLRLTYDGTVCLLEDPREMADPRRAFTENPTVPCEVRLEVRGI